MSANRSYSKVSTQYRCGAGSAGPTGPTGATGADGANGTRGYNANYMRWESASNSSVANYKKFKFIPALNKISINRFNFEGHDMLKWLEYGKVGDIISVIDIDTPTNIGYFTLVTLFSVSTVPGQSNIYEAVITHTSGAIDGKNSLPTGLTYGISNILGSAGAAGPHGAIQYNQGISGGFSGNNAFRFWPEGTINPASVTLTQNIVDIGNIYGGIAGETGPSVPTSFAYRSDVNNNTFVQFDDQSGVNVELSKATSTQGSDSFYVTSNARGPTGQSADLQNKIRLQTYDGETHLYSFRQTNGSAYGKGNIKLSTNTGEIRLEAVGENSGNGTDTGNNGGTINLLGSDADINLITTKANNSITNHQIKLAVEGAYDVSSDPAILFETKQAGSGAPSVPSGDIKTSTEGGDITLESKWPNSLASSGLIKLDTQSNHIVLNASAGAGYGGNINLNAHSSSGGGHVSVNAIGNAGDINLNAPNGRVSAKNKIEVLDSTGVSSIKLEGNPGGVAGGSITVNDLTSNNAEIKITTSKIFLSKMVSAVPYSLDMSLVTTGSALQKGTRIEANINGGPLTIKGTGAGVGSTKAGIHINTFNSPIVSDPHPSISLSAEGDLSLDTSALGGNNSIALKHGGRIVCKVASVDEGRTQMNTALVMNRPLSLWAANTSDLNDLVKPSDLAFHRFNNMQSHMIVHDGESIRRIGCETFVGYTSSVTGYTGRSLANWQPGAINTSVTSESDTYNQTHMAVVSTNNTNVPAGGLSGSGWGGPFKPPYNESATISTIKTPIWSMPKQVGSAHTSRIHTNLSTIVLHAKGKIEYLSGFSSTTSNLTYSWSSGAGGGRVSFQLPYEMGGTPSTTPDLLSTQGRYYAPRSGWIVSVSVKFYSSVEMNHGVGGGYINLYNQFAGFYLASGNTSGTPHMTPRGFPQNMFKPSPVDRYLGHYQAIPQSVGGIAWGGTKATIPGAITWDLPSEDWVYVAQGDPIPYISMTCPLTAGTGSGAYSGGGTRGTGYFKVLSNNAQSSAEIVTGSVIFAMEPPEIGPTRGDERWDTGLI